MISQKAIQEFKEIYRKKFKEELDDSEALDKALRLLGLYQSVYLPENINKESKENINKIIKK